MTTAATARRSPQYLWNHLVSQYPNVKMVFSGHVGAAASRTDTGVHGNTVYSFLQTFHDKQSNPVRLLNIDPAGRHHLDPDLRAVDRRDLPGVRADLHGRRLRRLTSRSGPVLAGRAVRRSGAERPDPSLVPRRIRCGPVSCARPRMVWHGHVVGVGRAGEDTVSFESMWAALEPVGRSAHSGGYRRYAWTREDHDLREWFAGECAARGLDLTEDRMGNQWAWWGDPDDAVRRGDKGVVTGSHLDSVPDGGAFDGPLGVVSALAAVDALRTRVSSPSRPIGVVNFVDEEGARFGVACAGSRVITGAMTARRARSLTDADGMTMAEALARGRPGPARDRARRRGAAPHRQPSSSCTSSRAAASSTSSHPVAVGSDIWPHGRWRLDFPGEANHAGTTRLEDRHDAMLGYAGAVLAAREAATTHGCVATVGKVAVTPGGVNAIPSAVTGWLDARGASPRAVRRARRRHHGRWSSSPAAGSPRSPGPRRPPSTPR